MSKFDADISIFEDGLGIPQDRPPRHKSKQIPCPLCTVVPIWDYESECFDCWDNLPNSEKQSHDSQYPCDLSTLE